MIDYGGTLLIVDLPEIPDAVSPAISNHIQVRWNGKMLEGYWGDLYLWDDFDPRDKEACGPGFADNRRPGGGTGP
jgi:hypothetical protein